MKKKSSKQEHFNNLKESLDGKAAYLKEAPKIESVL